MNAEGSGISQRGDKPDEDEEDTDKFINVRVGGEPNVEASNDTCTEEEVQEPPEAA